MKTIKKQKNSAQKHFEERDRTQSKPFKLKMLTKKNKIKKWKIPSKTEAERVNLSFWFSSFIQSYFFPRIGAAFKGHNKTRMSTASF